MKYLCYVIEREFCIHHELVVADVKHDFRCGMSFEISRDMLKAFTVSRMRERIANDCVRRMWAEIKKQSPGTYLDARNLGWLPTD